MSISAVSSGSSFQMSGSNQMNQMKQNFDDLGSALQSGNLDDAKKAYAKLQSNAPSQGGDSKNPLSSEIESLGKALNSGDLKGAQAAYAKIQDKMSQGPPAGASTGGKAQSKQDNVLLSSQSSSAKSSSSDSKVYDKKDTNKDGTVSSDEEMAYDLAHPSYTSTSGTATSDKNQGKNGVQTYA